MHPMVLKLAACILLFGLSLALQPAPLYLCSDRDRIWVPHPSLPDLDSCSKASQHSSCLVELWGVSVQEGETPSVLMAVLMDERMGLDREERRRRVACTGLR